MFDGGFSAWAQYTLRVSNRDQVQAKLKKAGVPTMIYYPIPMNRQHGYVDCPVAPGGLPESEALSQDVLSLPMYPYLDEGTQDRIVSADIDALA